MNIIIGTQAPGTKEIDLGWNNVFKSNSLVNMTFKIFWI